MRIEIWSDIACPWCYLGKKRFEKALEQFEKRDEVEVIWRSFELDSSAPSTYGMTTVEILSRKYGVTPERASQMNAHLTEVAALEGLEYHLDIARPGNTFDAHRLIHFAVANEKGDALMERLMRAYLSEGKSMSDRSALVELAAEVGLDAPAVTAMLESDAFAEAVRADEQRAQDFGVTGVPFFGIDETYGIAGAQPPEVFLRAMREISSGHVTGVESDEHASCGEEGCAVDHQSE